MKKKLMPCLLIVGLAALGVPILDAEENSDSVSITPLGDLVDLALRNSPSIKAAEFQVKGLHASLNHTWYLEAPEIGVDFFQSPISAFPNPIKNQMEIDYSVRQAFPFPGKIRSHIDAEHKHAEMGQADLEARVRSIIREIKTLYYELYLLDGRLEINRENQILMNRFLEIARRQYEVGMGKQSDILRAQTETTNLKSDSIMLSQSRRATEAMLNAKLNRIIAWPIKVDSTLTPAKTSWTVDQIKPLAEKFHPGLQGMQAGIRMREAEKIMAGKEMLPEFMVGGSFKNMLIAPSGAHSADPENYWSVMATMSIPFAFWSAPKYRAGVIQSAAYLGQAQQEYLDAKNGVLVRAQNALLKAQSQSELLRLSEDILLPQSQQALASNIAAYQGGKGEFMSLLDAYRMQLMARQNTQMARMQLLTSQAELEEAVGLDLDAIAAELSKGDGK
jgi:outer membrane protein, heavy metal efflux system